MFNDYNKRGKKGDDIYNVVLHALANTVSFRKKSMSWIIDNFNPMKRPGGNLCRVKYVKRDGEREPAPTTLQSNIHILQTFVNFIKIQKS